MHVTGNSGGGGEEGGGASADQNPDLPTPTYTSRALSGENGAPKSKQKEPRCNTSPRSSLGRTDQKIIVTTPLTL